MRYLLFFVFIVFFSGCLNKEVEPSPTKVEVKECPPPKICPKETSLSESNAPLTKALPCVKCKPCAKVKQCKPIIIYKEYKKLVLGEIEEVYFPSYKISLDARIDSGAQTSSMHAQNIVAFERDGKKWVRFTVLDTNKKEIELKKSVVKSIRVKRHGEDAQERYVIQMRVNISNLSQYIEISLNNRQEYKYPILIGRNFLRGNALVDVSLKHTNTATRETE